MRDSRRICLNFPSAASTLVLELLSDSQRKNFYVSVLYDGKAIGIGCGIHNEACPLDSFLKLIKKNVVNIESLCTRDILGQAVSDSYRGGLLFLFIFLGLLVIFLIVVLFLWRRSQKWKSIEEQSLRKYENHDANQI